MSTTIDELLAQGDLAEAIRTAEDAVKASPADPECRSVLVDLIILSGELERAETHLQVVVRQVPESAPAVALQRQLIRAEEWRQQFYQPLKHSLNHTHQL